MKKLVLALAFFWSFLNALEIPQISKYDRKITYAVFNAHQVFRIATGFSEGWELTDKGNLLFIKPKAYTTKYIHSENPEEGNAISEIIIDPNPAQWKTNLIVTTNVNMYVFELILNAKEKVYKLSFTYPQKELDNIQKLQAELKKQIEEDRLDTSLNRVSTPRNWDFYMKVNKESENIAPNFAYDDGVFTYLGFDNTKTFPAVFAYELGKESILNTHIKKDGNYDVLVIHKTLPKILLRSGDKVVVIFNRGYAKNPLSATPQTSNDSEVERVLLDEKSKKKEQITEVLKQVGESNE